MRIAAGPAPRFFAPRHGLPVFRETASVPPGVSSSLDLERAQAWRPGSRGISGTTANIHITETYHALDQDMSAYLGSPAVPNWMTFGKYASRLAGEQIIRLEEVLKAARRADTDALIDTVQDFLEHRQRLGPQGLALFKASGRNPVTFVRNAQKIRDALVVGNTAVYLDVVPAYRIFLQAESFGKDGVLALRQAGYAHAPKDPQGLLLPAFRLYQRAARERHTLTPEARRQLIHQANMLIVTHEQWAVVQSPRVFGDPAISRLMGAFGQDLRVVDVRGDMALLPHGGEWTDFATRMGYQPVSADTPGALTLFDPKGQAQYFRLHPEPSARAGTISRYFEGALGPQDAELMIQTAPARLPEAFRDGSDILKFLHRGFQKIWPFRRRQGSTEGIGRQARFVPGRV